jgi:hypothetical protein
MIVFDLRNEFHASRMKFGILGTKNRKIWSKLNLKSWKIGW